MPLPTPLPNRPTILCSFADLSLLVLVRILLLGAAKLKSVGGFAAATRLASPSSSSSSVDLDLLCIAAINAMEMDEELVFSTTKISLAPFFYHGVGIFTPLCGACAH